MLGPDGQPWHSWRVLILKNAPHPYSELYKAYRFDEPWDGPHNAQLAGRIGDYYRRQGVDRGRDGPHRLRRGVGPGTAWPGAETRSKADIRDGAGKTIIAVEMADSGIPWMKPEDLHFDRMSFRCERWLRPGPRQQDQRRPGPAGTGHVLELPDDFPPATLRAMLTIDGGEPVAADPRSTGAKVIDAPPAPSH